MATVRDLFAHIGELTNEIKALEAERAALRQELERLVLLEPTRKLAVEGLGKAEMTRGSTYYTYDAKKLDALAAECVRNGDFHTAQALADAREEKVRAETLRITMKGDA
jgi:hypothetical protein